MTTKTWTLENKYMGHAEHRAYNECIQFEGDECSECDEFYALIARLELLPESAFESQPDTQSIRRGCDGGCGRVLARYNLCEQCETAMRTNAAAQGYTDDDLPF